MDPNECTWSKAKRYCKEDICYGGFEPMEVTEEGKVLPCRSFSFLLDEEYPDDIRPSTEDYPLLFLYNHDPLMEILRSPSNPMDKWCRQNCDSFHVCKGGCEAQKAIQHSKEFIAFLSKLMEEFYDKYPKGSISKEEYKNGNERN